jgi:hypothetical protein
LQRKGIFKRYNELKAKKTKYSQKPFCINKRKERAMKKITIEDFKEKVRERIMNKGTATQKRNETNKQRTTENKSS